VWIEAVASAAAHREAVAIKASRAALVGEASTRFQKKLSSGNVNARSSAFENCARLGSRSAGLLSTSKAVNASGIVGSRLARIARGEAEQVLARFDTVDLDTAVALARLPEQIRCFGHVKDESLAVARLRSQTLYEQLRAPSDTAAQPKGPSQKRLH
jgi:hypothetical protein